MTKKVNQKALIRSLQHNERVDQQGGVWPFQPSSFQLLKNARNAQPGALPTGLVHFQQLPNGQFITVQNAPRSIMDTVLRRPQLERLYQADLWNPQGSKPVHTKFIDQHEYQDLKACNLGPRLSQSSGTCYFNASFNGLILGQRGRKLLTHHIAEFLSTLSPSTRQVFLQEPMQLDACPIRFTAFEVFRYMYAMLCRNSPTPMMRESVLDAEHMVQTKPLDVSQSLLRAMRVRTTLEDSTGGFVEEATHKILRFLGYTKWLGLLQPDTLSKLQSAPSDPRSEGLAKTKTMLWISDPNVFDDEMKWSGDQIIVSLEQPALEGRVKYAQQVIYDAMQLPIIISVAFINHEWGWHVPKMSIRLQFRVQDQIKEADYVLDYVTLDFDMTGISVSHAVVGCFCQGKPVVYDSAINKVIDFDWMTGPNSPNAKMQIQRWESFWNARSWGSPPSKITGLKIITAQYIAVDVDSWENTSCPAFVVKH